MLEIKLALYVPIILNINKSRKYICFLHIYSNLYLDMSSDLSRIVTHYSPPVDKSQIKHQIE